MKTILHSQIIMFMLLSVGCSSNTKIEDAIKEIYEKEVIPTVQDNTTTWILDYSEKRDKIEESSIKLQDKIDKITDTLSETVASDLPSKSDANTGASTKDDCLSTIQKWETPQIRVVMVTKRCVPDKGNDITIVATNK